MFKLMQEPDIIAFFESQYQRPLSLIQLIGLLYLSAVGPLLMGTICYTYQVYNRFSDLLLSPFVFIYSLSHILLFFLFTRNLSQTRSAARHMVTSLRGRKDDLAWLYIETIRTYYPYPTPPNLYYHFTNRQTGRISGSLAELNQIIDHLEARYPSMSIGYSARLIFRYWWSPRSLKTQPQRHRQPKETVITSVE